MLDFSSSALSIIDRTRRHSRPNQLTCWVRTHFSVFVPLTSHALGDPTFIGAESRNVHQPGGAQSTGLGPRMHPAPSQAIHPRLSVLSTTSLPTGAAGDRPSLSTPPPAARLSLPASSSTLTLTPRSSVATSVGGGPVPNIYDRGLNKTRTAEVSAAAFAFLFSEMVQYTQKRVSGIGDLERRSVLSPLQLPYFRAKFYLGAVADSTRWATASANACWSS